VRGSADDQTHDRHDTDDDDETTTTTTTTTTTRRRRRRRDDDDDDDYDELCQNTSGADKTRTNVSTTSSADNALVQQHRSGHDLFISVQYLYARMLQSLKQLMQH
jgi:hypothetical protein